MVWWLQVLLVLVPAVASGIFGGAVATWLRTRPAMKEAELKGEAALWIEIRDLKKEGLTLRHELARERDACDERIERIEKRHESDLEKMSAEVRILRHDRNNVRQALNAMFAMLKRDGADVVEVVAAIEEMLRRGDEVIAVEKGALGR